MFNDGFNERTNYIHNSIDRNRLQKMGPSNVDSSFAQMNVNAHKNDVQTVNTDKIEVVPEVQGNKENFVLRNADMMNAQENMNTANINTPNTQMNNNNIMFRNERISNLRNAFRK